MVHRDESKLFNLNFVLNYNCAFQVAFIFCNLLKRTGPAHSWSVTTSQVAVLCDLCSCVDAQHFIYYLTEMAAQTAEHKPV